MVTEDRSIYAFDLYMIGVLFGRSRVVARIFRVERRENFVFIKSTTLPSQKFQRRSARTEMFAHSERKLSIA